jgi:hypothetical protein
MPACWPPQSPRLLPALWRPGMTRQPRPSRIYPASCFSRRLAVTAPRAWSPHGGGHSGWRGANMGPVGQGGGGPAGCRWGFEADLIPAHRPMMSRTRMIHPTQSTDSLASWADMPIASAGVARAGKRSPRPRAGRRARSQSAGPRPQVLPCPERCSVHSGLGHAKLLTPGARRHPATYALRACSRALAAGSNPAPASRGWWYLLAVDGGSGTSRGHAWSAPGDPLLRRT